MLVKDNMLDRTTGAKKVKFDYLEAFDEIFGKQPNVTPLLECDSTNATAKFPPLNNNDTMFDVATELDADIETDDLPPVEAYNKKEKPRKKRKVDVLIEKFDKQGNQKQKVDSEKLEIQKKAASALERIAASFKAYVEKV
jgi:hypothetical protein